MFPIGAKPIGRRIIENLKLQGFSDIIFCISKRWYPYIYDYFEGGERFGVSIEYSQSDKPLGTAGEVRNAKNIINDDDFFVYYGDVLTNVNLQEIERTHRFYYEMEKYLGTLSVQPTINTEVGVIEISPEERITIFAEKVSIPRLNWSAIALFKNEVLKHIKNGDDFGKNVFPRLLQKGFILKSHINHSGWLDVGNLQSYKTVRELYQCK